MRLKLFALTIFLLPQITEAANCPKGSEATHTIFVNINDVKNELASAQAETARQCETFVVVKTKDELDAELAKIEKNKGKVHRMIISAHHMGTAFYNDKTHTRITHADFDRVFQKHPGVREDLTAMYLWGCYSGTKQALEVWPSIFPNLKVALGFTKLAPLDEQMMGADWLVESMRREQEFSFRNTWEETWDALDGIVGSQGNHHRQQFNLTAAAWMRGCFEGSEREGYYHVNQDYVGSNLDDFLDGKGECVKLEREFDQTFRETLLEYWSGERELVPASDERSKDPEFYPLRRKIYPWTQQSSHCFEKGYELDPGSNKYPAPRNFQIASLIYFHGLRDNFAKKLADRIEWSRQKLEEAGFPVPELAKLKDLDRKQLYLLVENLRKQRGAGRDNGKITEEEKDKLKELESVIENVLLNINPTCIDERWLEADKDPPDLPEECFGYRMYY
jgi:hypothetical protein